MRGEGLSYLAGVIETARSSLFQFYSSHHIIQVVLVVWGGVLIRVRGFLDYLVLHESIRSVFGWGSEYIIANNLFAMEMEGKIRRRVRT